MSVLAGIESITRDSQFALRQMARNPGFSAVALAAIALGIGANSTVFSFLNALQFRPAPVWQPERLAGLHRSDLRDARASGNLTASEYSHYRDAATAFTGLAAQNWAWIWFSGGERSAEWKGGQVSPNYFDVLGVIPHVGGFFGREHETSSVVLSYRAWIRTFDGDPEAVGRSVRLNGRAYTVVGVAPRGFEGVYLGDALDVWMVHERPDGVGIGRLAESRTVEDARAELTALSVRLAEGAAGDDRHARVSVAALKGVHPDFRRALAGFPSLLAAVTACLLAIACANIAGLLFARVDARRPEIALRVSLGASPMRLVRQLLTESALLSIVGGVLGLGVAIYGLRIVEGFFGYEIPEMGLRIDWPIVVLSIALAVATGLAFGVAPAWRATRASLAANMRSSSTGTTAIAVQVALSAVLLICGGLLFQSMQAVLTRPGLDPEKVAHFRLRPSRLGYSLERARAYQRELLRRVETVPGVERATIARVPPERGWCCEIDVSRPGEEPFRVEQNEVSPGFLPAMGIAVADGRDFVDGDRGVAIVNQALASKLWPGENALGREIVIDRQPHRVIGITPATFAARVGEAPHPYVYLPMWGRDARDPRLFVTMKAPAAPMLDRLRREIVSVDPAVHVGQESTLAGRMEMSHQRERLLAALLEFAAIAAVLLSAIGVYGLVSYHVSRRTREIGIRMALGAQANQVILWTMRRGVIATIAGLIAGVAIALQASRLLTGFLFGVEPADLFTFGAAAVVLATVTLIAGFLPARTAAHIDPAVALRDR